APAPCECGHTPGRAPFPTRRSSDLLVDALVVPLPVAIHGLVTGIEVRVGVAARGAADAHRAHRAQEPHPRLEPEVLRRERAHGRSEEHTSELQSRENLVCRLPLE